MFKSHRIRLYPNQAQANYFVRACGVARFAYNWALARWKELAEAGRKPNWMGLNKELNAIKREQFPWMMEVTKWAPAEAIRNLGAASNRYLQGEARYPRFKKKGVSRDRFVAGFDDVCCDGRRIRLPVIGWVRMAQELRFAGRLMRATVSRRGGRWFASVQVEIPGDPPVCENQATVGVDLGIKAMATCSDGRAFEAPMPLRKHLKRLKRLGRRLSRKVRGSRSREKAKERLARLYWRISNIRQDALHQATTRIVRSAGVIVLEDLNVRGMQKNGKLARAISDVGLYEFRRQMGYKAAWAGVKVIIAGRWFPSSKRCSGCGNVKDDLPLSERTYRCEVCGLEIDRDRNAAVNLEQWSTAGLAGTDAWGDRRSASSARRGEAVPVAEPGNRVPGDGER
jgi:putative transposase